MIATSTFAGLLAEERKVGRDAFVTFEGSRYADAPMAGATRPGRALGRQVLGPEVERRSLAIYDAIGGST